MFEIITFFITFLFIFGWKATEYADLILFTSVGLTVFSFIKGRIYGDRQSLNILLGLAVLSIYSLLITLLNGLLDTQIFLRSLRALVCFAGAMSLANIYYELYGQCFFDKLARNICVALAAHAAIMLCMYLWPDFRLFVYAITGAYWYVNLNSPFLDGFRISGLTYGLSQTSVLQLSGLLILPFLIRQNDDRLAVLLYVAAVPLLILSILISGRSGLLLGMIFLPICLGHLILVVAKERFRIGVLPTFLYIASGIIIVTTILFVLTKILPPQFYKYSLVQAEEVIAIFSQGIDTPTMSALSEMYFIPDTPVDFFFGSSNLGRGALGYIPSDVGWVKTWFAIGLIGNILMLLPYLQGLLAGLRAFRFRRDSAILTGLILASSFLLNFKELALMSRNQWSVQALLIAGLCLLSHLESVPAPQPGREEGTPA